MLEMSTLKKIYYKYKVSVPCSGYLDTFDQLRQESLNGEASSYVGIFKAYTFCLQAFTHKTKATTYENTFTIIMTNAKKKSTQT